MDKYKLIYDHEELLAGLSPVEKEARRKTFQLPIFKEMKELAEDKRAKVPDKGKLGIAIGYFLSRYEDLKRYVDDGCMPPAPGLQKMAKWKELSENLRSGETIGSLVILPKEQRRALFFTRS